METKSSESQRIEAIDEINIGRINPPRVLRIVVRGVGLEPTEAFATGCLSCDGS